jgi:hypothetical protein
MLRGMFLADFLGWNSQEWTDTIGLVVVFFVAFPLLAHGLIGVAVAQALGERQENEKHRGRWGRRPPGR